MAIFSSSSNEHTTAFEEAVDTLAGARSVVVLTGAGISVESGIPDFRSPDGLWQRYDPLEYASCEAFEANPEQCWELFDEIREVIRGAHPNAAHEALSRWQGHVESLIVVTQNIDGLHQSAGSESVVEFHGGASALVCMACGARSEEPPPGEWPPRCECGQVLKPDVVLFGDPIPMDALVAATRALETAEAIVVIGTSAQVAPFSELPRLAAQRGLPIIEVNLEQTALRALPSVWIQGLATEVVPALVDALLDRRG